MNIDRFKHRSIDYYIKIVFIVAVVLWSIVLWFVLSDRFVAKSVVLVKSAEQANFAQGLASIIPSASGDSELFHLKEYILSTDMLFFLENEIGIAEHFSDESIDVFSRFFSGSDDLNGLYEYYIENIVSVTVDDQANVLILKTTAFSRDYSRLLNSKILAKGESYINELSRTVAQSQVEFLEEQVVQLNERVIASREAILDFQSEVNIISPSDQMAAMQALNVELESSVTKMKAEKDVLLSYQSKTSPRVSEIDVQIDSLLTQIKNNQEKMLGVRDVALSRTSAEFSSLQMAMEFNLEMYGGALAALESVRVETARKLKKVAVLQGADSNILSTEPDRLRNTINFILLLGFLSLLFYLVLIVVMEHKD